MLKSKVKFEDLKGKIITDIKYYSEFNDCEKVFVFYTNSGCFSLTHSKYCQPREDFFFPLWFKIIGSEVLNAEKCLILSDGYRYKLFPHKTKGHIRKKVWFKNLDATYTISTEKGTWEIKFNFAFLPDDEEKVKNHRFFSEFV